MQVNATQAAAQLQIALAKASSQSGFQAALDAAKQNLVATGAASTTAESSESKATKVSVTTKTAAQELEEYMSKTPMQHMRDAILKELGLTEGDLAAMPPEQRTAVEDTITEKIKERLLAKDGGMQDGAPLSALSSPAMLAPSVPGMAAVEQLYRSVSAS